MPHVIPNAPEERATPRVDSLARLQERAARVRCALHQPASGGYLLTRTGWGMSRELGSLHEVSRVLAMIEST